LEATSKFAAEIAPGLDLVGNEVALAKVLVAARGTQTQ
jgi:hypothetical protein